MDIINQLLEKYSSHIPHGTVIKFPDGYIPSNIRCVTSIAKNEICVMYDLVKCASEDTVQEGDILVWENNGTNLGRTIFIYKKSCHPKYFGYWACLNGVGDLFVNPNSFVSRFDYCRPATIDEKEILTKKLLNEGYKWDHSAKQLVRFRERQYRGGEYSYYRNGQLITTQDMRTDMDDLNFQSGNYLINAYKSGYSF